MSRTAHARWQQVWIAEAVRFAEDSGPLDDSQALARSQRLSGSEKEKLLERAWLLALRLHWTESLDRLRDAGWLMVVLAAGLVVAVSNGLLFSVLADGRSINAASGFVSALGVHLLSLLFWLLSIALSRRTSRNGAGGLSIGRWLTAVALRLPWCRGASTDALVHAGTRLLVRERLSPWAFGLVSHLVWAFGFAFMLVGLLFAFAFREYQLTWETTLLSPDWFAAFARVTGHLPGLLGVAVPDLVTANGSASANAGSLTGAERAGIWPAREAAAWLLACVSLYGLVPRVLCAIWCAWVLRRAARLVDIDLSDPYYQQLRSRLQALEQAQVTDAEHPGLTPTAAVRPDTGAPHTGFAVVGFELDCDGDWLPTRMKSKARACVCIAGSMTEQIQLQTQLALLQPSRLLLVCNAKASPDRGTLRFMREAGLSAGQCALTFAMEPSRGSASDIGSSSERDQHADPAQPSQALVAGLERWRTWLHDSELRDWPLFDQPASAEAWALEAA